MQLAQPPSAHSYPQLTDAYLNSRCNELLRTHCLLLFQFFFFSFLLISFGFERHVGCMWFQTLTDISIIMFNGNWYYRSVICLTYPRVLYIYVVHLNDCYYCFISKRNEAFCRQRYFFAMAYFGANKLKVKWWIVGKRILGADFVCLRTTFLLLGRC